MNTKMKEGGVSLAPGQILSLSLFPHLFKGLLEAGLEDTEPGAWDWHPEASEPQMAQGVNQVRT